MRIFVVTSPEGTSHVVEAAGPHNAVQQALRELGLIPSAKPPCRTTALLPRWSVRLQGSERPQWLFVT